MGTAMPHLLCISLLSFAFIFCPALAAEPRQVFAHYKLYTPDSMDVFKQEIRLAQNKSIDAFALNTNSWRQDRVDKIYKAAKQVGSTFKLFFSADIHKDANNLTPAQLVTMLTRYANHPNQFKYKGKIFFTSRFGSDDTWWNEYGYNTALSGWNDVFSRAGGKSKFFFVPFFPTDGSSGGVGATIDKFGSLIDGLFAWDTSAWPYFSPDFQNPSDSSDKNYLNACNAKGKVYMAGPSPWFFKNTQGTCCSGLCKAADVSCGCQVKGNYKGPGLWMKRWEQLIKLSPPLVEIVTWNDWSESSYVSPPLGQGAADVDYFFHRAFLELGEYYIRWYKTGKQPVITSDELYIFYYTHSKNVDVAGDGCKVTHSEYLDDKLYATVILPKAGTLELISGNASQTFNAPVGVSTWSIDFQEGKQSMVLSRGGQNVWTVNGEDISNSGVSKANFNVWSLCSKCADSNLP